MAMKPFRDHCHHWVRRLNVAVKEWRKCVIGRIADGFCVGATGIVALVSRGEGEEQMAWCR